MRVLVDGASLGAVDYNHVRPDIQALFPDFNNTAGTNRAVGFRILDTTLFENGVHTISWTVTDNGGAVEGIGSRFFTVANRASAVTASTTAASTLAASARSQEAIDTLALDPTPLVGRRGWDLEASYGSFGAGASGVIVIRSEEVNRVELQLGEGDYIGSLRTPDRLAPLPIGSRLDTATNTFTWAPGVGFVGSYNFVFVRSANGRANRRTKIATRADVGVDGGPPTGGGSFLCALNSDATVTAFSSLAGNLVAGDTNANYDIFVRSAPANAAETMTLDKTAFSFGAVTSGGTFVSQSAAQSVRLTQSANATVMWSAVSNHPWLQVSPASGTGSGTLSIGVAPAAPLPPSGTVTGKIFLSFTGAANTVPPIDVSLTLVPAGTAVGPFGTVDTPADQRTGVTGAIPLTGWAIDDMEVTRVSICREAFGSEVAPLDPNCGGAAQMFVGFAVFIDGARPDVAAALATHPLATRAGWGFMLLTNFLPGQGNGTYRFTMRAQDREGNWFALGTRTMTCANASATLPFGTLDTPLQGGVASGSSYVNFGWALTPQSKTIPINSSTIHVLVDGVDVGTADYNHARSDIQALFPGFNNTNGAVGFRTLDTTTMTNGLHTISWTVTDNAGATEGLGSRFFTVANAGEAVTAAASSAHAGSDLESAPLETTPLVGRRGWDLEAPYGSFGAGGNGVTVIRSEEVNRVELLLGDGDISGYLRTSTGLAPLPIGSRLDPATNTFTWAPGVGFVGRCDFVFVRSFNGRALSRREVRIILHPKGRGSVGPQVVIDVPRSNASVDSTFMIGGWAADLDAVAGTGVTT